MDGLVIAIVVVLVLVALFAWFAVSRRRSRAGGVLAAPQSRAARRRGRGVQ